MWSLVPLQWRIFLIYINQFANYCYYFILLSRSFLECPHQFLYYGVLYYDFQSIGSSFKVFDPFWADFWAVRDTHLVSYFFIWCYSFPSIIAWRGWFLIQGIFWYLCWKLVVYMCVGVYFYALYFNPLFYMSVCCDSTLKNLLLILLS